ncbi:MAG: hypothetical protein IH591_00195, partial [Bacteroidales bacterium]|nr:hypothetical protein [Bacteroidales bacterium]
MKNLTRFLLLILATMAGFLMHSCDDKIENAKGMAEFSISLDEMGFTKAGDTSDSLNMAYHLLVSVEDRTGKEVLTDELIPVYIFGAGFVSEKVEIPAGEFILTKFMVVNASGSV